MSSNGAPREISVAGKAVTAKYARRKLRMTSAAAAVMLYFALHQNDPNIVPSTITTARETMAPTIATITMSK